MSDLIRRQNALDALKEYEVVESDNFTKTDPVSMMTVATIANCIEVIWELPSAEPERKWIPVTEALPKDKEYVIGWCGGRIDIVRFEKGISKEDREKMKKGEIDDPTEGGWCLSEGWHESKRSSIYKRGDEDGNNLKPYCWVNEPIIYFGQNCTAWMPLPEPYRGE